ncbi:MAG: ATPase [Pseudomonadota bacterium]
MIRAIPDEASATANGPPETAETAPESDDTASDLDEVFAPESDEFAEEWSETGSNRLIWVARLAAIGAIVAWSALYGWAMQDALLRAAQAQPSEWVRWIIDWSVPVLLICVVWLIAMRNSSREANRFAATAALLSQESSELETRLTVVNRELSLAREFLGAQSRELESLGRIAADRLSTHADELQNLIKDNGAQVSAIGTASDTALANMKSLRDDLPVVANSARDVNNQIGNAGRTANDQVDRLITGFERLNQFGTASENQVGALSGRIEQTVTAFENKLAAIEAEIGARFASLKDETTLYSEAVTQAENQSLGLMNERIGLLQTETKAVSAKLREEEDATLAQLRETREQWASDLKAMITTLDTLDKQAHSASQTRIRELHEEAGRFDQQLKLRDTKFFEEMVRRQAEFETRETQASEVLTQRLAQLDEMMAERRAEQVAETEKLVAQSTALSEKVEGLSALITQVEALGASAQADMGAGIDRLGEQLDAKRVALAETEASLETLTESGIRLLEIIQSGARHSREELPAAIDDASGKLTDIEERANAMGSALFAAGEKSEELSAYLIQSNEQITQADTSIRALHAKLGEQSDAAQEKLTELRTGLSQLTVQSEAFAGETQTELRTAIEALDQASRQALTALQDGARTEVAGFAERLSGEAAAAMETALGRESADAIARLTEAAQNASGAGREATIHLRDQLARVNELTGNLEQRIARARELAEEQVDNDFARRVALITDSLNSAAIDIDSALSTEVTDTAWEAYLKGDRGIFTRRAVRLLDNSDSREIAEFYQSDEAFNANVSRYIHDFEAMLRAMLSTRDGNALSVTVLGSDMGKLYVALAQAIERFRN